MQKESRLAVRIATGLEIDPVSAANIQQSVIIWFDIGIEKRHEAAQGEAAFITEICEGSMTAVLEKLAQRLARLDRQEFDRHAIHEVADDAAAHVAQAKRRADRGAHIEIDSGA